MMIIIIIIIIHKTAGPLTHSAGLLTIVLYAVIE